MVKKFSKSEKKGLQDKNETRTGPLEPLLKPQKDLTLPKIFQIDKGLLSIPRVCFVDSLLNVGLLRILRDFPSTAPQTAPDRGCLTFMRSGV